MSITFLNPWKESLMGFVCMGGAEELSWGHRRGKSRQTHHLEALLLLHCPGSCSSNRDTKQACPHVENRLDLCALSYILGTEEN